MTLGFLYWFAILIYLLGWGWGRPWTAGGYGWGMDLFQFVLFFLLGWKVFGFPIHG